MFVFVTRLGRRNPRGQKRDCVDVSRIHTTPTRWRWSWWVIGVQMMLMIGEEDTHVRDNNERSQHPLPHHTTMGACLPATTALPQIYGDKNVVTKLDFYRFHDVFRLIFFHCAVLPVSAEPAQPCVLGYATSFCRCGVGGAHTRRVCTAGIVSCMRGDVPVKRLARVPLTWV